MDRREFAKLVSGVTLASAVRGPAQPFAWQERRPDVPLPPSPALPEARVFLSGKPVASPAEWAGRRREILRIAATQMYGISPPAVAPKVEVMGSPGLAFDGLAQRIQVRLRFSGLPSDYGANLLLYIPLHVKKPPVILGLNFWGNHTLSADPGVVLAKSWVESGRNAFADLGCVEDHKATETCRGLDARRWPVQEILKRGYALATIYRGDIDPDLAEAGIAGLRKAFPDLQRRGDNFSVIAAWAWTLSRALDFLQTEGRVDARRVAVFGWSRLGKAAVWAGALDSRFAAVLSQESGAGGAKLFRRNVGEDIHRLVTVFPHWYCRNFKAYAGMDQTLPFDQHLVLAAIAPRPLYISSAVDDTLSDPPGEFASAALASKVYEFLGAPGLPSLQMPAPGSPLAGRLSYQIRLGNHDVLPSDWAAYFPFLERYF